MVARLAAGFAAAPGDTQEIQSEKVAILLVALSCCTAGIVWGATYWVVFGWGYTTSLPFVFVVVVGSSVVVAHVTRRHRFLVNAQILSIIVIPALIQWSVGGVFDSGFVLAWALLGPLGALMFLPPRRSVPWFTLYLVVLVVTVAYDDVFAGGGIAVHETTSQVFLAMNLGVSSLVVFVFAGYFVTSALRERARANRLLFDVLPASVAETLKRGDDAVARRYEEVSVLFGDIVGSTPLFGELDPAEVVDWLNEVFSLLDQIVAKHGLEKLRTMGDNYMVGSGVPDPRDDHAQALAACALEMLHVLEDLPPRNGHRVGFRFGINSGPVVAGVIGRSRFHYDLWGDTVNVASRMESTGEPGTIQVSESTYELLRDEFECEARGVIDVKGKGQMRTWFLVGAKEGTSSA